MSFATPLGLLGLLAVPAVLALHLFRRRLRQRRVAGLFLFGEEALPVSAGRRRSRLLRSPSLWLELLAATVLGLWLGGLQVGASGGAVHLVAVLDDSASMAAKAPGGGTVADLAAAHLRDTVAGLPGGSTVAVYRSGERPALLLGPRAPRAGLAGALESWRPARPRHALAPALTLAEEVAGDDGRLVLLTDEDPGAVADAFAVHAFGTPLPNAAITGARRRHTGEGTAVDLELRAWGGSPVTGTVVVEAGLESPRPLTRRAVRVPTGRPLHLTFEVPAGSAALRVRLSGDALALDDEVVLLPEPARTVRVGTRLDEAQRGRIAWDRLVSVLPGAEEAGSADRAHVLIGPPAPPRPGRFDLVLHPAGDEVDSWVGPFLLERSHELLRGVTLEGVVWTAGGVDLPGRAIVLAGDRPLMAVEDVLGGMRVHLDLDPARSNLTSSPDWPILVTNLVERARRDLPGPGPVNLRLGELVRWRTTARRREELAGLALVDPRGRRLPAHGLRELTWEPRLPGVHRLVDGDEERARYAVRFADPVESDLSRAVRMERAAEREGAATARGAPADGRAERRWLALLALVLLGADWFVLGRGRS